MLNAGAPPTGPPQHPQPRALEVHLKILLPVSLHITTDMFQGIGIRTCSVSLKCFISQWLHSSVDHTCTKPAVMRSPGTDNATPAWLLPHRGTWSGCALVDTYPSRIRAAYTSAHYTWLWGFRFQSLSVLGPTGCRQEPEEVSEKPGIHLFQFLGSVGEGLPRPPRTWPSCQQALSGVILIGNSYSHLRA